MASKPLLERKDVRPGCVLSLQTYGALAANFNPHCYGLVTDGAFSADAEVPPLASLNPSIVDQLDRRMLNLSLSATAAGLSAKLSRQPAV